MSEHKALKSAIAAVASVVTLGALQPSATATPRPPRSAAENLK
ncbi:hypothetical protein [Bifidobacterium catenulatum]